MINNYLSSCQNMFQSNLSCMPTTFVVIIIIIDDCCFYYYRWLLLVLLLSMTVVVIIIIDDALVIRIVIGIILISPCMWVDRLSRSLSSNLLPTLRLGVQCEPFGKVYSIPIRIDQIICWFPSTIKTDSHEIGKMCR